MVSELGNKAPTNSPTFTGTVSGINKSMVGLANVDNTTDASKPISSATQTAPDAKAPLASPTFTGTVSASGISATGQIVSTRTGNVADAQGQICLNGASGNRIDFGMSGGGAPTMTTRSSGTKLALYPNVTASKTDYVLGIESSTLWQSIRASLSTFQFKWYAGTTQIATLRAMVFLMSQVHYLHPR